MQNLLKLSGVVQPYAWGGKNFIPALLHQNNTGQKPFAEYWVGAHPAAPATAETANGPAPLNELIARNPAGFLGEKVAAGFTTLPFLFKILDVAQMLSIQVHPSKSAAEYGFADENNQGVPLKAPHRNYKDDNHKPELMVALSEFWVLHGFKPEAELTQTLSSVPELSYLSDVFGADGYKGLYQAVMNWPQDKVNSVLAPLVDRIQPLYKAGELPLTSADYWAAKAVETFCNSGNLDRGIFSIYFFNLLQLHPGDGLYQPAGLPHAYLQGQNVEVMANSDNVLRAGLTDKYIDVPELLKHVRFEATHPAIIRAAGKDQTYHTTAREFQVSRYEVTQPMELFSQSVTILFLYSGSASVVAGDVVISLTGGGTLLVTAGTATTIQPGDGGCSLYTATVPAG